jgi:D-arabinitol dehydrogenase (NADP+)
MIYGVTRNEDVVRFHPFDVFRQRSRSRVPSPNHLLRRGHRRARTRRVKTDGIITHRFLDDYGKALQALSADPTVHKVVIAPWERTDHRGS